MQFVKIYKDKDYSEEEQARPCKFAFARNLKGGRVKVLHKPVLCRDFLNDSLVWIRKEKTFECDIYGYDFRGVIDQTKVNLYMIESDWKPGKGLVNNLPFLHQLETEVGIPCTTVLTDDNNEYQILGDGWWMQTTVHFSFYTYLLRQLTSSKPVTTWEEFPVEGPGKAVGLERLKRLHLALKALVVTSVSGTAKQWLDDSYDLMHGYNGFSSQITRSAFTVYGQQLNEFYSS